MCGLLSGVAVPVVSFSSRDWQKQLTEKRSALDSYFSGLYFPPRGCLAQVQSLGRGSIRSAVWMVFHLQGINEKGNGKNFWSYLWRVSKFIYDQDCDSILYILACLLMGMWWRKKGRRALRFVGDHLSDVFHPYCVFLPNTGLSGKMWIGPGYERLYYPISNPLNCH